MVRQPAVAGTFYPADATILRQTVKQLLTLPVASFETEPLKALIVPHAGYVTGSGDSAAGGECFCDALRRGPNRPGRNSPVGGHIAGGRV
jgi:MEMO1 family protein